MTSTVIEPLFLKNRDLIDQNRKKATAFELCRAMSEMVEDRNIEGAQIVRGVWKLYLKNNASRMKILTEGLAVRGISVTVYDDNPYRRTFDDSPVEKITIKDLPLSMDSEVIEKFLKEQEELSLKSTVRFGREKDSNGAWTQYKNGDRFVYALAPIIPALPREAVIGGVPCRIFHSSQDDTCKSCKQTGHKAGDEDCPALDRSGNIQPFRTHENVLSNYAPCKLTYLGTEFNSLEHLYQWLKATDLGMEGLAEQIRLAKHAGAAHAIARDNIDKDLAKGWEEKSVPTMYTCLEVKAKQCTPFKEALQESGENMLVEATSNLFWAGGLDPYIVAITKPEFWPGKNMLGELLMRLRQTLQGINESENSTFDENALIHSSPVGQATSHQDDAQHFSSPNNSISAASLLSSQTSVQITSEGPGPVKETREPSILRKVGSLFKSNTGLNRIDNFFQKENKKRRASASPPKEKGQKTSRKEDDSIVIEDSSIDDSQKSPSILAGKSDPKHGNTNHKPNNPL